MIRPYRVPGASVSPRPLKGVQMFAKVKSHLQMLLVMLTFAMFGAVALASATPTSPATAVDGAQIATEGLSTLNNLVTDALPFIIGAIGLGIALRWVGKVFRR